MSLEQLDGHNDSISSIVLLCAVGSDGDIDDQSEQGVYGSIDGNCSLLFTGNKG